MAARFAVVLDLPVPPRNEWTDTIVATARVAPIRCRTVRDRRRRGPVSAPSLSRDRLRPVGLTAGETPLGCREFPCAVNGGHLRPDFGDKLAVSPLRRKSSETALQGR